MVDELGALCRHIHRPYLQGADDPGDGGRGIDPADVVWYGVIGGAGIRYDVTGVLETHGLESAVFAIAQNLPLTGLLAVVLIFLISTFFLTSANSAALALAMFVSGKEDPGRNLRAFWGVALGAVTAVLAGTGSLTVIQTASIATAFPPDVLVVARHLWHVQGPDSVSGRTRF